MNRRSILPNSCARILLPIEGAHGTLQVKLIDGLDDHGLFFTRKDSVYAPLIAIHNNGYSCHNLAERLIQAWDGQRSVAYALEQFDYILSCGGLAMSRPTFQWIAEGCKEEEFTT